MDTAKIKTTLILKTLSTIAIVESLALLVNAWIDVNSLFILAIARIMEAVLIIIVVKSDNPGLNTIGLKSSTLSVGLKKGIIWSAGFGILAGLLFIIIYLTGNNPVLLMRSHLPGKPGIKVLFMLVGGVIAPITEEIFFRGIVYSYIRRWNVVAAVILSAVLFAGLHLRSGFPIIQFTGGLVFAIAFEKEKSLMTPITIHVLGNLAIFTLSIPWIQGIFAS